VPRILIALVLLLALVVWGLNAVERAMLNVWGTGARSAFSWTVVDGTLWLQALGHDCRLPVPSLFLDLQDRPQTITLSWAGRKTTIRLPARGE
jgi:hypothetical protein